MEAILFFGGIIMRPISSYSSSSQLASLLFKFKPSQFGNKSKSKRKRAVADLESQEIDFIKMSQYDTFKRLRSDLQRILPIRDIPYFVNCLCCWRDKNHSRVL